MTEVFYCRVCVYPSVGVNLSWQDGVCTACVTAKEMWDLPDSFWEGREKLFGEVLKSRLDTNRESNYDCVIPVSGGKDSYYQTHKIVNEYGLKPLLVTYHGNNYLPEGDWNRNRMREVFDADHLVMGPSVEALKKLNRVGFRLMGDMNWHAHCGIFTFPIQIAARFKIPLVIWGEIAWDISGMFSIHDLVEFSARNRHEHSLRGYEWEQIVDFDPSEGLSEKDMQWAKYPTDSEISEVGVSGLYLGNFFPWRPDEQTNLMMDKFGWIDRAEGFQRTYKTASNLDDKYENGAHDYLKYVKFGYGRASDHASKDIRLGRISRDEAVDLVMRYDHVFSDDILEWLDYVEMDENEFWKVADSFRDPRVWWIENNTWFRKAINGKDFEDQPVRLEASKRAKFER